MPSIIRATTTSGLQVAPDNSGSLELQTNGTTTAITIDTSQRAAFVAGTAAAPAITTTGDTNTGMFFPAADTIAFAEGGTEAMRLDSSGNVGIGTTSPSTKLSVAGEIQSTGFYPDTTLTDTTARTYTAGTYYSLGSINISNASTFLVSIYVQYDNIVYHNWIGGGIIGLTYWNAASNFTIGSILMDTHVDGARTITLRSDVSQGNRTISWTPSSSITVSSGGYIRVRLKQITAI